MDGGVPATTAATAGTTWTDAEEARGVNTGEAAEGSLPVSSAAAVHAQPASELAGWKTAATATAIAAVDATPTDADEAEGVTPAEADFGSPSVSSARAVDAPPADVSAELWTAVAATDIVGNLVPSDETQKAPDEPERHGVVRLPFEC